MISSVRLCIFDLGGVVIRLKALETYREMPGYPRHMAPEELWDWFEELPELRDWESGRADVDAFAAATIAGLGLKVSLEEFRRRVVGILDGPMPGMEELIGRVASKVATVALSNTNALHWPLIMRDYPAVRHFRKVFASHLLGCRKPERKSFRKVLDEMRVEPAEALLIDDTQLNVDAARGLGLQAIRFENTEQCARLLAEAGL